MPITETVKRLAVFSIGIFTTEVLGRIYDYVLYPFVILKLGLLYGSIVMTTLSTFVVYGLIWVYNQTRHDWFGLEWLQLESSKESKSLTGRILRIALRRGKMLAFILLSIEDPLKAFVFIRGRKGSATKFNKLDWEWFFASNLISNFVWIIMVSGALELVKYIFA